MIAAGAVQRGRTTNRRVNRILNRLGKRTRATEACWFKARLTRLSTFQGTLCQPRSTLLRCLRCIPFRTTVSHSSVVGAARCSRARETAPRDVLLMWLG